MLLDGAILAVPQLPLTAYAVLVAPASLAFFVACSPLRQPVVVCGILPAPQDPSLQTVVVRVVLPAPQGPVSFSRMTKAKTRVVLPAPQSPVSFEQKAKNSSQNPRLDRQSPSHAEGGTMSSRGGD
jgi:hypothetical protein